MSNFSISGKLYSATQPEQKSESFKVRNFILLVTESGTNGQAYTNYIGFQLVNNNCDLINTMAPGQDVTVHFNLRGNLYQDRSITNLQVWKIEAAQQQFQQAPQQQWQQPAPAQPLQQWQQPSAPPAQQGWGQQNTAAAPPPPPPPTAPQQPQQQTWNQPLAAQQPAWPAPNQNPTNNNLPF